MFVLAVHRFVWLSPVSGLGWLILAMACGVIWWCIRWKMGRTISKRSTWWGLLRGVSIMIAALILLGPTMVDEQPGIEERPPVFLLLDGSQSMQLGGDRSRWQECLDYLNQAFHGLAVGTTSNVRGYRFGHQLKPLRATPLTLNAANYPVGDPASLAPPDATDSRLADALRQLLPQIDATNNAGVVLLSDGRVRASESVEQLAAHYRSIGIPIHVVPVGQMQGSGDIAIVSVVLEPRVRKYTENQVTLFLRSFGFAGQRTVARVYSGSNYKEGALNPLAEMPITLDAGAQSVTLSFRTEDQPMDLWISIDALAGELTDRNNRVKTHVDIDRTKIRVLYVEGDTEAALQWLNAPVRGGGGSIARESNPLLTNVRDVLQVDEDVECAVLIQRPAGGLVRVGDQSVSGTGFPASRAELFAYDCIILSNVGPKDLTEDQQAMMASWIEGRGGGLIMTGAMGLVSPAWQDSPLERLLPVTRSSIMPALPPATPVRISQPGHPIWRLRLEQQSNTQLLSQFPPMAGILAALSPKPTAEVLAVTEDPTRSPVIVVHRAGRGRVLVANTDLGGQGLMGLAEAWGPQPERIAGKLWRNLVYWTTEGSQVGRRRLVANTDKRFYRPGETIRLEALAYDEGARKTDQYAIVAMLEPVSLEDTTLYSPVLWPENVRRLSGEGGPRIAWGEEIPLQRDLNNDQYAVSLTLSELANTADEGFRLEMTAYERPDEKSNLGAGDQVGAQIDSIGLSVQVLNDPFEQENPLPNRELLARLAGLSGGQVLESPKELSNLLQSRKVTVGPVARQMVPAWNQFWVWSLLLILLTVEWIWRRLSGFA